MGLPQSTGDLIERTVTVLFTDVEGSTELRARLGDQAAHRILRTQSDLIRQQIAKHSGREVKDTGDGVMAAFGSARRAVSCAAEIQRALDEHNHEHQDPMPAVRIGVNSGEVNEEGGDLFGAAVNAAARVAAKAKGGEILISSVVRQLSGKVPDVSFADRGRFRLKGFEERWQLFEVVWKPEAETITPVVVERTAFVGRDVERKEILGYLAAAAEGHGGVVMIGGEPGIGKTRLTEEIKAQAESRGFRALTGHSVEMEGGAPYMPFVEILEKAINEADPEVLRAALGDAAPEVARILPKLRVLFPDIPAPLELPPEQERRFLLNSIQEFIARAASNRPQLYVLDDLHWADEATVLLLQHLAEHINEMPVLVLVTYRDVELDAGRPLARALEDFLRRHLAPRVSLKRLPYPAVAQMLRTRARGQDPPDTLVDVIHRETEGNPFFVEEVFRHLNEAGRLFDTDGQWQSGLEVSEADVPAGVRLVIGRRLERLSENARACLATAAVIGRNFGYRVLEAATDLGPDPLLDAIDEAERAGLIVATSEGAEATFAFAHELIRQTLLAGLSLPRRQRWHLRVADAMEAMYGVQAADHAAELAHHLFTAGQAAEASRTARFLSLAGDRATEAVAFEDALSAYEKALNLQPLEDRRGRAELLSRVGLTRFTLGMWDAAMDAFDQAVGEFEALGDGTAAAELCYRMAYLLVWRGRFQEVLEVSGRGLAAIGDVATAERARLLLICSVTIGAAGGYDLSHAMITEAGEIASQLADPVLLGDTRASLALEVFMFGRYADAVRYGLEAFDLLRAERRLWELVNVMGFVEFCCFAIGNSEISLELHEEIVPLYHMVGHPGAEMMSLRSTFCMHLAAGDLDTADRLADEDLRLCRAHDLPWWRDSHVLQAGAKFAQGDWEAAVDLCRQAGEYDFPWVGAPAQPAMLALSLAYIGQHDEAMSLLDGLREDMPVSGGPNGWGSWHAALTAIEAFVVMGEHQRAAELAQMAETVAVELGWIATPFDGRVVRVMAAIAAAAGEDWERADQHFQRGRIDAERLGPRSVADCDYFEAWALLRRGRDGDRERGQSLLVAAAEGYRTIGMPRHVLLAQELAHDP